MNGDVGNLGNLPHMPGPSSGGSSHTSYREDLRNYIVGLILAVILTAVPFGLVYSHAMPKSSLLITIGALALIQGVVHFRYFLHIRPGHGTTDELLLILFTALILIMMAGGTVWILGNLHARMM